MSGGGSPQPNSFQHSQAQGVDLNSSNYGKPIPVVYGQNKVAGNCVWYGDFQVIQTQLGGKGGGGGTTSYDYHSSYMLCICEGPITAFDNVWQGSSYQPLSGLDPAFQTLGAIAQAPWSHFGGTQAIGYSGWALVAWLNMDLGGQAVTPNYQFEVGGLVPFGSGVVDSNPAAVLSDVCTNAIHGIHFNYLGNTTQWSNYCVANSLFLSPVYDRESTGGDVINNLMSWTNSAAYFSEGVLKIVPYGDTSVTGNGVTYTPDLTPAWNFTDADYLQDDASTPPVTLKRKALPDTSNTVRVQYNDRSYYYYSEMVEARDENDAITNGVRALNSINIPAITQASVARFVAQNKLQRELYIRNTYEWKASWRFEYLEPTDPVTLTDTTLGITNLLVRITQVDENEDGSLAFTAEELPIGVGHSENYNTQLNGGYTLDVNEDPGPIDTPVFFRQPGFLTPQNQPAIGIALSGSTALWGGGQIFLSYDGINYYYKTTWSLQARYGILGTGGLPTGSDPDLTNMPTVTLEQGQLIGGTQVEADSLQTLCLVDSELISYETATLQSGETYQLSYLRRGAYGTVIAAHSAGATLIRLDDTICYLPIDPSYVGQTVYVKVLSFNLFGKTPRTLASETAYSYVVGTNANLPDVPAIPQSFTSAPAPDGVYLSWNNLNPAAVNVTSIERSAASTGPWTVIAQVGNAHNSYHDIWSQANLAASQLYYYRARALGSLPQAGFSAYTATINSTANAVSISSVTGTQSNLCPDSSLQYNFAYWPNGYNRINSGHTPPALAPGVTASGGTAFEFAGSGFSGGSYNISSQVINVQPGTYTLSAWMDCVSNSGTTPLVEVANLAQSVSYGSLSGVNNSSGRQGVGGNVIIPSGVTQVVVSCNTNNTTLGTGSAVYFGDFQLEKGSVMTGYRRSNDNSGFGVLAGSGNVNVADLYFNYTVNSTTQLTINPTNNEFYLADGTLAGMSYQTSQVVTGLAVGTWYCYPYADLSLPNGADLATLAYAAVTGGSGVPAILYGSPSLSAVVTQNNAYHAPLSSGGISMTIPSTGSGGGSGGGSNCLHPGYLDPKVGDSLRTPQGMQPVSELKRYPQTEWIRVTLNRGECAIVTPSHCFLDGAGEIARARDLRLKSILKGDGCLLAVTGLEWFEDATECIALAVPCGFFYARPGGVLHKNGTVKP